MGLSSSNKELLGLANKYTDGDMTALANNINEFLVSVSSEMPRLNSEHRICIG